MDKLLRPAYEPGDGQAPGSQLVNGEWYLPVYGCDSLQVFIEQLPYKLTSELIGQVAKYYLEDIGDGYGKAIFDEEAFARDLLKRLFMLN
jgi:hypothetical protein